jgi:hypothetical protein
MGPNENKGSSPLQVWTHRLEEKLFASAGDQTPVFESVVRHYTDSTIPAQAAIKSYSGRKITESMGNVTVRGEKRWKGQGGKHDGQQSV